MASNASVPATPSTPDDTKLLSALARLHLMGGRLRLLGLVLLLVSLGMGWLQWQAGAEMGAIWSVAVGGIGSLALFALADMAHVVAALGSGELPKKPSAPKATEEGR